ncbi:hypothetical protein [Marivirga sp.]|uniref:hypothetical protein n=1 Tax=Marivirga sp. TaxID=2018662 RepID=UPI002D7E749D|nr:hypothetical protein [Marivirga sp.]HET8860042.1 hypothetical protein [Marivirga sp.]
MNPFKRILLFLPVLLIAFSCEDDMEDVMNNDGNQDDNGVNIVEMTVGNSGASAYFVSEINGNEEVTSLNEDNSTWALTVGTRYELNVTGASAHPFALRDTNNEILLSMNSTDGSFEGNADVNFQISGSNFSFTLTQELADALDNYVCTIHLGMSGSITTN